MKFDRIKSTTSVVDWAASTSYAYGQYFRTPELGLEQWYRRNNIDFKNFNNKSV